MSIQQAKLTLNRSNNFRVVLTVSTLLADNNEESADDITAAATDASPEIFRKVFMLMILNRMNQSENDYQFESISYQCNQQQPGINI